MLNFIDAEAKHTELLRDTLITSKGYWGYSQEQLEQYKKVDFNTKYDLNSLKSFIESAVKKYKYLIVEEEDQEEPDFTIGMIEKIGEESIIMKCFNGIGQWIHTSIEIKYLDITSLQVGSNYLNVYERHFNKKSN